VSGPSASPGHAPHAAAMPLGMLATLSVVTFLVNASASALAPFLLDIARDLGTTLGPAANLIAVMSISWGVVSVTAGAASDRIGRRPVLVAAVLALGVARLGFTLSQSYGAAVIWQLLAGVGGGGFMGTVFATVSDRVAVTQHGRALGWVITGQSLSLVAGVPLVTLLGAFGGWRAAIAVQAGTMLVAATAVWLSVPAGRPGLSAPSRASGKLRGLIGTRIVVLLVASTMERICFASVAVYLSAFLLETYAIPMQALALALALVALGNLAGNVLGGGLADRAVARPLVFAVTSVLTGALGLPLMLWHPGIAVSVALGFVYSFANAAGRPALMAALSEVPAEVRGTILGFNITMSSIGWLGAAALGGWLMGRHGFASLGVLTAAAALAGAALAACGWRARGPGSRVP
jgi:MFS transporter, DHA1 family, inner membrane transport protein